MDDATGAVADLTDALGRVVRHVVLPRFAEIIASMAGTPLDRSAYVLLVNLLAGSMRVSELAEQLSIDVSTVSRQAQALEDAGLARRERHPTDGRSWLVVITGAGRSAVDAHRQARRALFADALREVPPAELETVTAVLHRLGDHLEALTAS